MTPPIDRSRHYICHPAQCALVSHSSPPSPFPCRQTDRGSSSPRKREKGRRDSRRSGCSRRRVSGAPRLCTVSTPPRCSPASGWRCATGRRKCRRPAAVRRCGWACSGRSSGSASTGSSRSPCAGAPSAAAPSRTGSPPGSHIPLIVSNTIHMCILKCNTAGTNDSVVSLHVPCFGISTVL
jgi:hypothetical protein